jgi:monovalent cation:proton antiporter-2 (CPA2) family protein
VWLAKQAGLGSVLGYLVAGLVIGPVFGLVGPQESAAIQHYAEFGVVMMLFIVGLELEPAMLWRMRSRLLGLGGLQVSLTAGAFFSVAWWLGLDWRTALAVGLLLSLSSTAIVLQTFQEKGLSRREGARGAFSVLLFQDIAVIPMLAVIPLLALPDIAGSSNHNPDPHGELSLVQGLSGPLHALVLVGSVGAVILGGHFLSRPLFRTIAQTGLREAFTVAALMLVVGIAVLMSLVGLSPALGTFLAGVVLANSEFRHELKSDIEPFKGLLLGLFFITVGAGVQFAVLVQDLALIAALTFAVIAVKALLLILLARLFHIRRSDGWLFALSLAQAGEFGFVLITYAYQNHALSAELVPTLSAVIAASMFLTPLLFIVFDRVVLPRYAANDVQPDQTVIEDQAPVIIAGIGRFGQIVNRVLRANGIHTVVLDRDPKQIDNMREVRIESYFGDATRTDLLHAAGIDEAALLVVAIDDQEAAIELVRHLRSSHPNLRILARAYDRGHLYALREAGVHWVVSETYHSALETAKEALHALNNSPSQAARRVATFDQAEARGREVLYESWLAKSDGERFGRDFRTLYIELEEALEKLLQDDSGDTLAEVDERLAPETRV